MTLLFCSCVLILFPKISLIMKTGASYQGSGILVVDDSIEILEVIKLILEQQGYQVFTKDKPDGIVDFVQNNKIGLLLWMS